MKDLLKHPIFGAGLALRLLLIFTILPAAAAMWYIPFLSNNVHNFSLFPYHSFLIHGGALRAFPYGHVMWLCFLPLTALCHALGTPFYWGYAFTLLLADIGLLFILRSLFTTSDRDLLFAYWLSPILLFATYWLGLNDLIPVFFLCLALLALRRLHAAKAGSLCGLAISAKLSMVLAAPLFLIYLYRKKTLRHLLRPFITGLGVTATVLTAALLVSPNALRMIANNPEINKIYSFAINDDTTQSLYVLPMAYLLILYTAWHMKRLSFDLFFALLGILFFLVLLLTPAAPGWFLWVLPFLVFYQVNNGRPAFVTVICFTLLYVITNFLSMDQPTVLGSVIVGEHSDFLKKILGAQGQGLLNTALLTVGSIIMFRAAQDTIRSNTFFRISRRPFLIGIAGDSGVGKDTLVQSLIGLFGGHSVVSVSGDGYHFWDRHKPMWRAMTHLNPRANDLQQLTRDVLTLAKGKPIQPPHYDHITGKHGKSHRICSNDFIIISGLQALYQPILRQQYDLSIYLGMDEALRQSFKIKRDVAQRNNNSETVLESLERREKDAQQFIRPQEAHADLVLSLHPISSEASLENTPPLKLQVRGRYGLHDESLVRRLVGECGLFVDMKFSGDDSKTTLTIEGEASNEDIAKTAQDMFPDMMELLDSKPQWKNGVQGLMQLFVLSYIHQALQRRHLT